MSPQAGQAASPEHPADQTQNHSDISKKALIVAARLELFQEVIEFLGWMKRRGERELGRNPQSEDLLQFFQKYAWRVIEVRDKENVFAAPSLKEARGRIWSAIDRVLHEICKRREVVDRRIKPAGIWFRTVRAARRATDFNIAATPFGEYDYRVFLHPKRQQLRALLRVQAEKLVQEFLEGSKDSTESATTPDVAVYKHARERSRKGEFPQRAKWLERRMFDIGLTVTALAEGAHLDEKTIRNVLNGHRVSKNTLMAIVQVLSIKGEKLSYDEIPDC